MSESTPRKRSNIKRTKSGKCAKKVTKIKIPTPTKRVRLTTPRKGRLQNLSSNDGPEKKLDSEEIDTHKSVDEETDTHKSVDEETEWQKLEEDPCEGEDEGIDWQKLEEELERNAVKANLTTINVKSILHHILSDKRVIELAQMVEKDSSDSSLTDVCGETKLTRSKARALGYQPLPLPAEDEPKATILDVEFPDSSSSSDEEYHPQAEEEDPISDEELSALSDFHSETQSPCLSNSTITQQCRKISETLSESETSITKTCDSNILICPLSIPNQPSSSKDKSDEFIRPDLPSLNITKENEVGLISSRTRSRFPMPGVEVEDIAAEFEPPDIPVQEEEENGIQHIDDPNYIAWLNDLTKPLKALNDTGDDDPNDEDFNYMQEVDDEQDTELENEEFRYDKATKVTQKELQELFNNVLLGFEDDYMLFENWDQEETQVRTEEEIKPSIVDEAANSLEMTAAQRAQIVAQIQQHVQLLTQIYMTTCTIPNLKEASQCKDYVEELHRFQTKASNEGYLHKEYSIFRTPGISDAYRIMKSLQGKKIKCNNTRVYKHKSKTPSLVPINDTIVDMFVNEPYFATYIELLPDQGMEDYGGKLRQPRMKFNKSEDNLLALGLVQFHGPERYDNIREHLLPIWSAKQLRTRAKNLNKRCVNKTNPVAQLRRYKTLPHLEVKVKIDIPREISSESLADLPRTIWKGRVIPEWHLKMSKKIDSKTPKHDIKPKMEPEAEPTPCEDEPQESEVRSGVAPAPVPPNVYHGVFNQPGDATTCYENPTSTMSNINTPVISGASAAPTPVLMVPPSVMYQNMPMFGYAMVPMMYCPTSGISVLPTNISTPKSMATQNSCYSEPAEQVKKQTSPNSLTPVKSQKIRNTQSADKTKKVKRALNYNKCMKNENKKKETNKRDTIPTSTNSFNAFQINKEQQSLFVNFANIANNTNISLVNPVKTTNLPGNEVEASKQNTIQSICTLVKTPIKDSVSECGTVSQNSVKFMCTPVKNIMNEFGISSLSSDSFNIPFMTLIKDLPSPSSFPHLMISPSKPLHETSLPDVKQVLVTPKKFVTQEETYIKNEDSSDPKLLFSNDRILIANTPSTCLGSINYNPPVRLTFADSNTIVTVVDSSMVSDHSAMPSSSDGNSIVTPVTSRGPQNTTAADLLVLNCTSSNSNVVVSNSMFVSTNSSKIDATNCTSVTTNNDFSSTYNINRTSATLENIEPGKSALTGASTRCPVRKFDVSNNESYVEVGTLSLGDTSNYLNLNTLTKSQTESITTCSSSNVGLSVVSVTQTSNPFSSCPNNSNNILVSSFPLTNDVQKDALFPQTEISNSPSQNNDVKMLPVVVSSNDVASGDDESSIDAHSGGMESQTDDNTSECAEETPEGKSKNVAVNEEKEPDVVKKRKTRKHKKPARVRKKINQRKKYEFNVKEKLLQRKQDFARMYLQRVKTTLADNLDLQEKFFLIMQEGKVSKLQTYFKVADLFKDFPGLVDNFCGFLDQHEARHVGKFFQWLTWDQIINFHLLCEQYFFNTPGWYMKIVEKILEVTKKESDSVKIFNAVVPMFRGNQNLMNHFRRLFPDLTPPPCSDDAYEVIDFGAVTSRTKDIDDFEEIQFQPPDSDTPLKDFSKRKSKTRDKGKKTKFSMKNSNTKITASRLRELASKRKKNKASASHLYDTTDIENSDEVNNTADEETIEDVEKTFEKCKNHEDVSKKTSADGETGGSASVLFTTINYNSHVFGCISTTASNEVNDATMISKTPNVEVMKEAESYVTDTKIAPINSSEAAISNTDHLPIAQSADLVLNNDLQVEQGVSDNFYDRVIDGSMHNFPPISKDNFPSTVNVPNDTVVSACEPAKEEKRPLPFNIIPFKSIRTVLNNSFFESSNSQSENSHSGNSQLETSKCEDTNDAHGIHVHCVKSIPEIGNKPVNNEKPPVDDSQNCSENKRLGMPPADDLIGADKAFSLPSSVNDDDIPASIAVKSEHFDISGDSKGFKSNNDNDKTMQNATFFPDVPDESIGKHTQLSQGILNAEQDLAFQENSTASNQCALHNGMETKSNLSTLSFTHLLTSSSEINKSSLAPASSTCTSSHSLMQPPTITSFDGVLASLSVHEKVQSSITSIPSHSKMLTSTSSLPGVSVTASGPNELFMSSNVPSIVTETSLQTSCDENYTLKDKVVADTQELQFSEHSIATNQLLPISDSKTFTTKSSSCGMNIHKPDPTSLKTSSSTSSLSFTGKIVPLSSTKDKDYEVDNINAGTIECNKSLSDYIPCRQSLQYSLASISSVGTTITTTTANTTTEGHATMISSQKSVDIDFKVGKINDVIEISSDTLLSSANIHQEVKVDLTIPLPTKTELDSTSLLPVGLSSQSDHPSHQVPSVVSETLSIIGEVSSSASGDAEVEEITNNAVRGSTHIPLTSSPAVDIALLHSNNAQFNVVFENNSNDACSLQEALLNSIEKGRVDSNKVSRHELASTPTLPISHLSRNLTSSPTIMMSNTEFSKETTVTNKATKKKKRPRKLSRSEITTLAENTRFQDDSSSSFEDNYSFSSFVKRKERSASETSDVKDVLNALPYQKVNINEFSGKRKGKKKVTKCTVEIVEVKPPKRSSTADFDGVKQPSSLPIPKQDEDSQHSNRSFSCGFLNSPQTPISVSNLSVSNYVEIKSMDADTTPNTSFNVIDNITQNLLLNSEVSQKDIDENNTEDNAEGKKIPSGNELKQKRSVTPKKKSKRKKEDIRNMKVSDIDTNKSDISIVGPLKRKHQEKSLKSKKKLKKQDENSVDQVDKPSLLTPKPGSVKKGDSKKNESRTPRTQITTTTVSPKSEERVVPPTKRSKRISPRKLIDGVSPVRSTEEPESHSELVAPKKSVKSPEETCKKTPKKSAKKSKCNSQTDVLKEIRKSPRRKKKSCDSNLLERDNSTGGEYGILAEDEIPNDPNKSKIVSDITQRTKRVSSIAIKGVEKQVASATDTYTNQHSNVYTKAVCSEVASKSGSRSKGYSSVQLKMTGETSAPRNDNSKMSKKSLSPVVSKKDSSLILKIKTMEQREKTKSDKDITNKCNVQASSYNVESVLSDILGSIVSHPGKFNPNQTTNSQTPLSDRTANHANDAVKDSDIISLPTTDGKSFNSVHTALQKEDNPDKEVTDNTLYRKDSSSITFLPLKDVDGTKTDLEGKGTSLVNSSARNTGSFEANEPGTVSKKDSTKSSTEKSRSSPKYAKDITDEDEESLEVSLKDNASKEKDSSLTQCNDTSDLFDLALCLGDSQSRGNDATLKKSKQSSKSSMNEHVSKIGDKALSIVDSTSKFDDHSSMIKYKTNSVSSNENMKYTSSKVDKQSSCSSKSDSAKYDVENRSYRDEKRRKGSSRRSRSSAESFDDASSTRNASRRKGSDEKCRDIVSRSCKDSSSRKESHRNSLVKSNSSSQSDRKRATRDTYKDYRKSCLSPKRNRLSDDSSKDFKNSTSKTDMEITSSAKKRRRYSREERSIKNCKSSEHSHRSEHSSNNNETTCSRNRDTVTSSSINSSTSENHRKFSTNSRSISANSNETRSSNETVLTSLCTNSSAIKLIADSDKLSISSSNIIGTGCNKKLNDELHNSILNAKSKTNLSNEEIIKTQSKNIRQDCTLPKSVNQLKNDDKGNSSLKSTFSNSNVKSKIDVKTYLSRSRSSLDKIKGTKDAVLPSTIHAPKDTIKLSKPEDQNLNNPVDMVSRIFQMCQMNMNPSNEQNSENRNTLGSSKIKDSDCNIDKVVPYSSPNLSTKFPLISLPNTTTEEFISKPVTTSNECKIELPSNDVFFNPNLLPTLPTTITETNIQQEPLNHSITSDEFSYSNISAPSPQIPLPPLSTKESHMGNYSLADDFSNSNLSAPSPQIPLSKSDGCELSPKIDATDDMLNEMPEKAVEKVSSSSQSYSKWRQNEDQIILTTFMALDGDEEKTKVALKVKMPSRSLEEIKSRMDYLREHLYEKFGISSGGESEDDDTDSQESSS